MPIDIVSATPSGRLIVQGYGGGRFRIGGEAYEGSVLVLFDRVESWSVRKAATIVEDALAPLIAQATTGDLVVIGCGPRFLPPPAELRAALKRRGLALEWMDTGAACRTFNVLLAEERRVAAALIAVD